MTKYFSSLCFLLLATTSCQPQAPKTNQEQIVGGPCEGCEAIFEYGDRELSPTATFPDYEKEEPKMKVSGTIFKKDGKTPAGNVLLYLYQTNRAGLYTNGDDTTWGKRHGALRIWLKTNSDGKYSFYTFRPAAYPDSQEPEHIHITVKEPGKTAYYLDEYVFADDPLLTDSKKSQCTNRGGSGITTPAFENGMLTIKRDLILGLNIPDYD